METLAAKGDFNSNKVDLGIERMTARCWRKLGDWKLLAYQVQTKEQGVRTTEAWWGSDMVLDKLT